MGKIFQEGTTTSYDPGTQKAVLRCSICTGEKTAGFKDLQTGKFEEVMLIRTEKILNSFAENIRFQEKLRKSIRAVRGHSWLEGDSSTELKKWYQ